MNLTKSLISLISICAVLSLSSCSGSSFFGGEGSGEEGVAGTISDQDLALEEQRWEDGGKIPEAEAQGLFGDVYFAYDSSKVRDEDLETIRLNAEALKEDPSLKAEIEGHCDERGTTDYNYALGEQRAKTVAELLVNYGASPSQLSTISYGEEIPLDQSGTEDAFSKNRRVHFALFRNKK